MPYLPIIGQITQSTLCFAKHWRVTGLLMCPDRIPEGQPAHLYLDLTIAGEEPLEEEPDQPESDKPVTISFQSRLQDSGQNRIGFVDDTAAEETGEAEEAGEPPQLRFVKGFTQNTRRLFTILGSSSTPGGQPDIILILKIDDEEFNGPNLMSVGPVSAQLQIKDESGAKPPAQTIPLEQGITIKAVVTPAPQTMGEFHWASVEPDDVLTIRAIGEHADTAEVVAHAPGENLTLCVIYVPPSDDEASVEGDTEASESRCEPALMAVCRFKAHDLEREFNEYLLSPLHLLNENYRNRLEEMSVERLLRYLDATSDETDESVISYLLQQLFNRYYLHSRHLEDVEYRKKMEQISSQDAQRFLEQATQEPIREYLTRLLDFLRQQEALQEAQEAGPFEDRPSITFIMGQDPPGGTNRFYTAATDYFRSSPTGRVVTNLRSLLEVRNYLASNPPGGDAPRWGRINIIVHANAQGELSIPVIPGSREDASAWTLEEAVEGGSFAPLPDDLVDVLTQIHIGGCAVGQSEQMLSMLSIAFGGDELQRPAVFAPMLLQGYYADANFQEEFLVEFWYVEYKGTTRPSDEELVGLFREKYPEVTNAMLDWQAALGRNPPTALRNPSPDAYVRFREDRWDGYELRRNYFPIPQDENDLVRHRRILRYAFPASSQIPFSTWSTWREIGREIDAEGRIIITYEFETSGGETSTAHSPPLPPEPPADQEGRMEWLRNQQDLQEMLDRIDRTVDSYDWSFTPHEQTLANGSRQMTLTANGVLTVVRIERQLTEGTPPTRSQPPVSDARYYGSQIPARAPEQPPGENILPD